MREAGRSRFDGGSRIMPREGGKRGRKINEGTERREDVDTVIVVGRKMKQKIGERVRKGERVELRRYKMKKAGGGEKKWKRRMDEGD